jgi:hypothetical protein
MKKQIDVFMQEMKVDIWNEDMNRWENCSFDEAGIEDGAEQSNIEIFLREEYQARGYEGIQISFN